MLCRQQSDNGNAEPYLVDSAGHERGSWRQVAYEGALGAECEAKLEGD